MLRPYLMRISPWTTDFTLGRLTGAAGPESVLLDSTTQRRFPVGAPSTAWPTGANEACPFRRTIVVRAWWRNFTRTERRFGVT
jgi:hypothetical protein